jgi:hypothetical protein
MGESIATVAFVTFVYRGITRKQSEPRRLVFFNPDEAVATSMSLDVCVYQTVNFGYASTYFERLAGRPTLGRRLRQFLERYCVGLQAETADCLFTLLQSLMIRSSNVFQVLAGTQVLCHCSLQSCRYERKPVLGM